MNLTDAVTQQLLQVLEGKKEQNTGSTMGAEKYRANRPNCGR